MKHSSLGGNCYVVIFVDDCTRFKVVKFVKKKSDTTAALLSLIAGYITPHKLSIKCVRTGNGGEFEGEFQRELDRRSITHEHNPPDTPQYNGVAERVLGLLRETAINLMEELDDVINVPREKLWTQAMLFACDVISKSVTTLADGGKSPYELWFGKSPTADHLRPFGAVGYARRSVREHKMAPKGEKCVFMGIPRNFPTGTVSVLLVRTRNIVERQAVQWVDGPKKTGGNGTGSDDRGMKSAGDGTIVERETPQLNGAGTGTAVDAGRARDAGGVFRTRRGDAGDVLETRGGEAGGVIKSRRGDAGGAFGTRAGAVAKGGGSGTCIGVGKFGGTDRTRAAQAYHRR